MLSGKNILLGITGGIAAYKTTYLVRHFIKAGAHVKVIMTPASFDFVTPLSLSTLSNNQVYTEFIDSKTKEWTNHVDLALWADLFIIAPATLNTISKITSGICDNLLLATYFSAKCPVFVAPAMDLDMYKHPVTQENINKLKNIGVNIIYPTSGELASGLVGEGRMEEPDEIFKTVESFFNKEKPLNGKTVLITAGPTFEKIDPVRFISNYSTGKMGYELAQEMKKNGANVILVSGPTQLSPVNGIITINVHSAQDMLEAVLKHKEQTDVFIMSAAVADYRPVKVVDEKIKKKDNNLTIDLSPTTDILKTVGESKRENQIVVGFALETNNQIENATKKLHSKNADFIVLNTPSKEGTGFGYDTNKVTFIDKNNNIEIFELKSKQEVAKDISNKILTLLPQ